MKCDIISPSVFLTKEKENLAHSNCKQIGLDSYCNRIPSKFYNKWAGLPIARIIQLTDSFKSKSELIWNAKGESGLIQILDGLKFSTLKKNKYFLGSGDFTLLFNELLLKKKGILLCAPNAGMKIDDASLNLIDSILKNQSIQYTYQSFGPKPKNTNLIAKGGSLISLTWALGSSSSIDFENAFVYFDRLGKNEFSTFNNLIQLKNKGNFNPEVLIIRKISSKKKIVLKKMLLELFPHTYVIFNLKHESRCKRISFPLGVPIKLDLSSNTLKFNMKN